MTQPDPFADQNAALGLVAPLQDLAFTSATLEPGQFRLRAEVPFPGDGPRPVVVVHVFAEATGLTPAQIEELTAQARGIRAGFALVLSAGVQHEPETGGIEVVPPEPVDPLGLVVDFEVLNPTADPFVAQLLAITTLLGVIHDTVTPDTVPPTKSYNMHKNAVYMHVKFGNGARLIGSDGKGFDAFVGQDCGPAAGQVVKVHRIPPGTTGFYLY